MYNRDVETPVCESENTSAEASGTISGCYLLMGDDRVIHLPNNFPETATGPAILGLQLWQTCAYVFCECGI